jgi:hypothetical protein
MINYQNGNGNITLKNDGTRIIEYENNLKLDWPLNIDIRVSTSCSLGFNPKTLKSVCSFCHESAVTNGIECDYSKLKNKLFGLPRGIELAIGANSITNGLIDFLSWSLNEGYICNLTINQLHLNTYTKEIEKLINDKLINGLGISFRTMNKKIPEFILNYQNTVLHVICGIDSINDIIDAREKLGFKKLLILGEKNFGFNIGNVNLTTQKHKQWLWWVAKLFKLYDVVSFDNLALEQLQIRRFFTKSMWDEFYQMEHSFYINAVDNYFAPSSRSDLKTDWNNFTIKEYFKQLNN